MLPYARMLPFELHERMLLSELLSLMPPFARMLPFALHERMLPFEPILPCELL